MGLNREGLLIFMINFPYELPLSVKTALAGLPRPAGAPSVWYDRPDIKIVIEYRCGKTPIFTIDWLDSFENRPLEVKRKLPVCRNRSFFLSVLRIYRGKRYVKYKRLHWYSREGSTFVSTNTPTVRMWLKNGRIAGSRFSRKRQKPLNPRPLRPNPESVSVPFPAFYQVGSTVYTNTTTPTLVFYREWSGVRTPNFGSLKKRFLPVNNHHVDMQTNLDGEFIQVFVDPINPDVSSVFISSWTALFGADTSRPPELSHDTSGSNVALERLTTRIGSSLDANLAQDIAQFGQLSSMMNSTVSRLVKSITSLRRRDFPGAISALWHGTSRSPRYRTAKGPSFTADLANNWLELQYGWKPLLMDIDGSMRSLAQFYQTAEHVARTASASAKVETITKSPIRYGSVSNPPVGYWINRNQTRYRYAIRYRVDSRLKAFLAQTGFTNPINLVWEVLPYSFVVDWFLPIGNYLQSSSSFDGLEFLDGVETRFTRQLYSGILSFSGSYPIYQPWQEIHWYGSYQRERIILDRIKLTSFPKPEIPTFKNPLSVTHVLNSLALLRGAFGR